MIERPVLTDIEVRMRRIGAYDVAPEKMPDLLAERPLLHLRQVPRRPAGQDRDHWPQRPREICNSVDLRPADARRENAALRALWARKWVEMLEDELHMGGGQEVEDAITSLGLGYSLLTPFTSFVAVDSQVVNREWQLADRAPTTSHARGRIEPRDWVGRSRASAGWGCLPAGRRSVGPCPATRDESESQPMYAPATAVPSSMPEEPASAVRAAGKGGRARVSADSRDEAENKTAKEKKGQICSVKLIPGKSQGLGDSKALLAVIRRVAEQQGCAQAKSGSTLRLRITVDRAGKIAKVERLAGDEAVATPIAQKLTGESSATVAKAAPDGTLDVTIKF